MSRLDLLQEVVKIENKLQSLYDQAKKSIARMPLQTGTPTKGKIVIEQTDQEAIEIIYNAIRHGAELGEEEGIRQELEEMVKQWPV